MNTDRVEELTHLAQALGQPLPAGWAVPLARFTEQWEHYLEYQVSLDGGALGIVTLGHETHYLEEIEAYLQEIGVLAEAMALYKAMRRFTGQATWGLKVSPGEVPEVQLYAKKPLAVTEVLFWLQQHKAISQEASAQVMAVAGCLGKTHTHFLGADFSPGQPVRYQIYFTQYLHAGDSVPERVQQVLAELRLPDTALQHFERYHPLLAQPKQTLWLSVGLAEGALLPSLKLDYEGVRLGVAGMVLEDLNLIDPQLAYLDAIGLALQIDTADYLGMRLAANRQPALSVYLTRARGL
jgi:hypothetical protein